MQGNVKEEMAGIRGPESLNKALQVSREGEQVTDCRKFLIKSSLGHHSLMDQMSMETVFEVIGQ